MIRTYSDSPPNAAPLEQGGTTVLAISTTASGVPQHRRRGRLIMEGGNPLSDRRSVEFRSRDALFNVIPLPPAEAALDDSGYSLHGTGADAITCSVGTPDGAIGAVTRLSPTVVWVMPKGEVDTSDARGLPVYLTGCGVTLGPIRGAFIRTDAETAGAPVGLQLANVSLEQGRQILTLLADALKRGVAEPAASALPVQDTIDEAERIRAILLAISTAGNKGVLRRMGRTVRLVLERYNAETEQLEWHAEDPVTDWGEAPYDIDVIGHNSAYRMRLEAGTPDGQRFTSPLPDVLFRIRHRWHRRSPAPEGVRVTFHHPLWREQGEMERAVLDLSFSGMCIRCRPEDLLFPGLLPPLLELHTPDGQSISLRGEIRYVTSARADGTVLCGLSVSPYSSDEARWVRFVSQTTNPNTCTSDVQEEGLWDVFTLSGFFSLANKSSQEFDALKQAFSHMAKRAAEVPQLFCQAVWPSERGPEATLSIMKSYRHTWMGHQVAKRPGKPAIKGLEPGRIMHDLYVRCFEHPQSDADFRWAVAYVEGLNPWIARAHVRYGERHMAANPELAFTRKVHMMDIYTAELTGRLHEGITVSPATSAELTLLTDHIAHSRPSCYVEALDFTRDRIDMRAVQGQWNTFGLEREREVLIARRNGVALAAAVLELGQQGTNLYSLLDMARLFPLSDAGPSTYVALVDAARRWYAARHRRSFHYLCEDDGGQYVQEAGIHAGPDPYMWIISAKLIPDYLEHISEVSIGRRSAPNSRQG
ncbi:hypothetical protein HNV28_01990 [Myxococcus xanthus]|uniref:PilZ domain-containing protein n=2 Tax=Myxococcus xanthus TaxID=34 RepID=A0A7Y4ID86_MYXXA|nr:hypothetical protein [Myxococcus xanthus]NOJ85338.1 hypothetical protein [Myxococcus xanthus]